MKALFYLLLPFASRADIFAVPHPSCKFDAAHTVVWTPLFQAAWDELNQHHGAGEVTVSPPNQVMKWLDGFEWKRDEVLPEKSWFVHAGAMTPELYEKANETAQKQWGMKPFHYEKPTTAGGGAALAMLMRQVTFVSPFERSYGVEMNFQSGDEAFPVHFFGSLNASELGSTNVLYFSHESGTFALEAKCKEGDDRVIFYMPPKEGGIDL